MAKEKGFIAYLLSSKKQRERFVYFRSFSSIALAIYAYFEAAHHMAGVLAVGIGLLAMIVSYKTISPVIALIICMIEGMFS